jgi:hypothetical protein
MTAAANPLSRLAPCMRLQSCVHLIHQHSKDTPTAFPELRIEDTLYRYSTIPSTRSDDEVPEDYLLKQETAFNIHKPSLDHRDR